MASNPKPLQRKHRQALLAELVARARSRLPEWRPGGDGQDLAYALFEIAARLGTEVEQRLDQIPEKNRRGFMHWLGLRGQAGRAARAPVVFSMVRGAEAIDAPARIQLQASAVEPPVTLETEHPLRILPARLRTLVASSPLQDGFSIAPTPLLALEGPGQGGTRWTITRVSSTGDEAIAQANPPQGLEKSMILQDESGRHHEVIDNNNGLIRLRPAPDDASVNMTLADRFQPFASGKGVIDRQTHALYIGDEALLDLSTEATITIGGTDIGPALLQAEWAYWGTEKDNRDGPSDWCPLIPDVSGAQAPKSITLTKSGNGIIKALELGGRASRWLRAQPKSEQNPSALDGPAISDLSLAVTVGNDKATNTCEGIANTTPLVLNPGFYPLGREPRQFDAFYLGSNEAFSKKGAEITLELTLGDQFATPFFWVDANNTRYLFAIGNDGKLKGYRVDNLNSPKRFINTAPIVNGQPVQFNTKARPAAVFIENTIYVAAIESSPTDSDSSIWILSITHSLNNDSQWQKLLSFPTSKDKDRCDCILLAHNTIENHQDLCLYTITISGILRWTAIRSSAPTIDLKHPPIKIEPTSAESAFVRLAPIFGSTSPSELEIIAISDNGNAELMGVPTKNEQKKFAEIILKARTNTYPYVKIKDKDNTIRIYYLNNDGTPTGTKLTKEGDTTTKNAKPSLLIESSLAIITDITDDEDLVLFVSATEETSNKKFTLHAWRPFNNQVSIAIPDHPVEADITQGPVIAGNMILLATKQGTIISATRDPELSWRNIETVLTLLGIDKEAFSDNKSYVAISKNKRQTWELTKKSTTDLKFNTDTLVALSNDGANSISKGTTLVSVENSENNEVTAKYQEGGWHLNREINDTYTSIKIKNEIFIFKAKGKSLESIGKKAEPSDTINDFATYACTEHVARQISLIETTPSLTQDLSRLSLTLIKCGKTIDITSKQYVHTQKENKSLIYFLDLDSWGEKGNIVVHSRFEWTTTPTEKPRNPELSWEYWNGRSWWQIEKTTDKTGNLINTGTITITTPDDIEPTDVLGRRNHWIRARLVGGDYGEARTTVTLETDSKDKNKQYQTVHRDPDSINAPYVAALKLGYELKEGRNPQAVLTHDNGSWHDQSAAARTAGASLSGFVSLASALTAREADPQGDEGPWQQRGLYLGFDAPLSGQGLSLFCLVDTPADDEPDLRLALDVLGKDGFRPVTGLQDGTGGLQQSGTLVFNLSETPVAAELFGQSAWWLRLRMADPARESDWNPILRGAWLNGAWAIAADTLTMEILGSASGAPSQSVRLTHSPVVEGSLELRVREPLGDEEVAALLAEDADAVRHNVADRPGIWVRWHEVDDIDDATQGQRAYALDDASGEIRFGDGVHGRAPDGGQDAIVAFSYRRGGGAQANGIKAWSPINLSTPLQGVDNCQIVDAAAGGSDAQDGERALAFAPARLHTRERALTLADLENLTRQFSPDIAQARAWTSGQQSRLVVVMARRGSPEPDRGTLRELRKYLVDRSLPGLVRHLGLRRPRQRPLTVLLHLWADDLGLSGQLEAKAYQRIEQLLDPASGGLDQQGWPLGCAPSEADIAAALDDLGNGCGLTSVEIRDADGKHAPAPLARDELVTLAPKGVRCEITQGGTPPATRQEGPCHA